MLRLCFLFAVVLGALGAAGQPDNAEVAAASSSRCDLMNLERSPPLRGSARQNVASAVSQASTCVGQRDAACAEATLASVEALPLTHDEQALLAVPRAELATLRGDHAEAERLYREALALPAIGDSLRREITWRFGFALIVRGEFAETLRLFDAIACDGWTAEALALRAVAYQNLGARDFALESYEAAWRLYDLEGRTAPAAFKQRRENLLAAEAPENPDGYDRIPLYRANPDYPSRAMGRGLEGWVEVEFEISDNGKTENVRASASSNEVFEQSAIAAVQRWRYRPQFENGLPVARGTILTRLTFCLDACNSRLNPRPKTTPEGSSPTP